MSYSVVFDAAQKSPHWEFPAFGLVFVTIGLFLVFSPKFKQYSKSRTRRFFGIFYLSFSLLWTVLVSWSIFAGYVNAQRALKDNKCDVVEGIVEHFKPMPYTGHMLESFDVNGKHFAYSDYVITPFFNQTTSHGGPIHERLPVRITYSRDYAGHPGILKLEVQR